MDCKSCLRPFNDDALQNGYCKQCIEDEPKKALEYLDFDEYVAEGIRQTLNQSIRLLPEEEQTLSEFQSIPKAALSDLVVRYAQSQGPATLSRYLKKRYDLTLSPTAISTVLRNSPRLLPIIQRLRSAYAESLESIPIYNKAWRLVQLQYLFDEAEDIKDKKSILADARVEAEGIKVNKQISKRTSILHIVSKIEQQNQLGPGLATPVQVTVETEDCQPISRKKNSKDLMPRSEIAGGD